MPRFRSSSHPPAPTEPLFVLADLQEFGAPGQGGPVLGPPSAQTDATTSTTTPSPTSSSYKRFSDMSVASALSFRDDTKLDYARASTPVRTSLSARQQEPVSAPYRTGSFGALLSPDMTFGGDAVSFQNLPIPRRRPPASSDAPPPPTSRRNARIFPRGPRPFSVMSSSTEQDWLALTAAMRSPPRNPVPDATPMCGLDSFSDMFTGETAPRGMIRDPLVSAPASVPTRWSERQSRSPFRESSFLSPPPPLQQAHSAQPYYRISFVPSLDSPLSSSCSSSFPTPSLKRGSSSSSTNIASPPVTPASASSSSGPQDAANPSSNGKLHGILEESLFPDDAVMDDYRHARRSTDETETIRLEELLDKEKEDSPPLPRSSPHPPRVELSFILDGGLPPLRSESLSPDGNWCQGECEPHGAAPSKPRCDAESNFPIRNPRTGRRPPPLQLTRTSQVLSSMSAPPAEGTFEVQSDPRSQRRSAYVLPSNAHLPIPGPKSQRSSVILIEDVLEDAQQFAVERETRTHSPFGKLRSQGSSDSLSPYHRERDHDPVNEPEQGSPYTPRTPEFARPPSEYSVKSIDFPRLSVDSPSPNDPIFSSPPYDEFSTPSRSRSPSHFTEPDHELEFSAWPGMKKWRSQTPLPGSPSRLSPSPSPAPAPASAPAPLSPVVSVHSDHSVTGSIRSGITKLFSIGMGGRSRSGSNRGGGPEHGPGVRSSNSFDLPLPPSTTSTVSLGSLGMSTNTSPSTTTCASRAEQRRLRKEAARARTEKLAQELAEKARRRAEVGKARKVAYVQEKSMRPWEEAGAMYQGLSYL